MSIVDMVRNGYQRISSGVFVKLVEFPRPDGKGNFYVERITRDRDGKILRVRGANHRR